MSRSRALEVRSEHHNDRKWRVALSEDVFCAFYAHGGEAVQKIFAEGSLFSPLLFQKFFDPADAFPLWEFGAEVLLSGRSSSTKSCISWTESDNGYFFRAELPVGARNAEVAVCEDKGSVIEISGQWKRTEITGREWKNNRWWEHGFVRRLEMPDDADGTKMEACINNDLTIEIKIPKNASNCSTSQLNAVKPDETGV